MKHSSDSVRRRVCRRLVVQPQSIHNLMPSLKQMCMRAIDEQNVGAVFFFFNLRNAHWKQGWFFFHLVSNRNRRMKWRGGQNMFLFLMQHCEIFWCYCWRFRLRLFGRFALYFFKNIYWIFCLSVTLFCCPTKSKCNYFSFCVGQTSFVVSIES